LVTAVLTGTPKNRNPCLSERDVRRTGGVAEEAVELNRFAVVSCLFSGFHRFATSVVALRSWRHTPSRS
jgi:hypothetical protein